MCEKGPGPGAYLLPPTIGYTKHDPSRYRNPQYSMGRGAGMASKMIGPGPTYDIARMTRYGKATPPAFSLASRPRDLTAFCTPGPGTYTLDFGKKFPAYTMSSRHPDLCTAATPGPNQYTQPTCIGPKVPHKPAAAAYSITGCHGMSEKSRSPGPATYDGIPVDNYKLKQPKFSMSGRNIFNRCDVNPGPAAYLPRGPKCCPTGYSFGARTVGAPYITADDYLPCIDRK